MNQILFKDILLINFIFLLVIYFLDSKLSNGHFSADGDSCAKGDVNDRLLKPEASPDPLENASEKVDVLAEGKEVARVGATVTEDDGDEMIVIQDTGFNIKIAAPGMDAFDLPVSAILCHSF